MRLDRKEAVRCLNEIALPDPTNLTGHLGLVVVASDVLNDRVGEYDVKGLIPECAHPPGVSQNGREVPSSYPNRGDVQDDYRDSQFFREAHLSPERLCSPNVQDLQRPRQRRNECPEQFKSPATELVRQGVAVRAVR